jgi:hypothetical protein
MNWKRFVRRLIEVLSRNLAKGAEENYDNSVKIVVYLNRDSIGAPPVFILTAWPLQQPLQSESPMRCVAGGGGVSAGQNDRNGRKVMITSILSRG